MTTHTDEKTAPATQTRSRFAVNLFSNVGTFGLSILIGFWYTPFLLHSLGTATYGMIPLANSVVVYLSLATIGLNSAVSRYLTIAIERGDREDANRVFNASLFGTGAVVAALVVPIGLFAAFADTILQIPPGQAGSVQRLYLLTAGAFLISTLASPFLVATYSRNRFDIRGGITTIESLTRVGAVVALFFLFSPNLLHVGAGLLAAAAISAAGAVWSWRKLTPELTISWAARDWKTFREISQMGGWVVVSQIGAILFLNVDLLVVNRISGPEKGGHYAALLQLSMLLRNLGGSISGVFGPTSMGLVARGDFPALLNYLRQSIRFVGIVLAIPIGLLCGFAEPLLSLWLGPTFRTFSPLLVVMILPLAINLAVVPLFPVFIAINDVRHPGYVTLILGFFNLLLALLLAGPLGWDLYGIAIAGAVVLTLKNVVYTPMRLARLINANPRELYTCLGGSVCLTLIVTMMAAISQYIFPIDGWLHLSAMAFILVAVYVPLMYFVILTPSEKDAVSNLLAIAANPSRIRLS